MIISTPWRLRMASLALFLSIPLIALEVVIATRSPIWKLPYKSMGYWSLAFLLICIPLSSWISEVKKWAFSLAVALAILWTLATLWTSIQMRYPPMGFFSIVLMVLLTSEFFWIRLEMQRSFLDPQLKWYQGYPKPISNLKCSIYSQVNELECKVSRIDQDGLFLYVPQNAEANKNLPDFLNHPRIGLRLSFNNKSIQCEGSPIISFYNGMAAGIQFRDLSSDTQKEVSDFVEILRGHGYV